MLADTATATLRERRLACGLTQAELGRRAGVSRQLVAAAESGGNVPAVDAALALARALGSSVEALFAPRGGDIVSALDRRLPVGALVRVGSVGDRLVAVELPDHGVAGAGWAMPDGIVEATGIRVFPGADTNGLVLAGCDPALGLIEQALSAAGRGRVLAVSASSGAALSALAHGRAHAAVVHGPPDRLPSAPGEVLRLHLARWRVGLGVADRALGESLEAVLHSGTPVVQREPGASSQQALLRALAQAGATARPSGPHATGHLDAARRAAQLGCAAVTMEAAAKRFELRFLPLEDHTVEVWIAVRWAGHPAAEALGGLLTSAAFTARMAGFGGYDLTGSGDRIAPV